MNSPRILIKQRRHEGIRSAPSSMNTHASWQNTRSGNETSNDQNTSRWRGEGQGWVTERAHQAQDHGPEVSGGSLAFTCKMSNVKLTHNTQETRNNKTATRSPQTHTKMHSSYKEMQKSILHLCRRCAGALFISVPQGPLSLNPPMVSS